MSQRSNHNLYSTSTPQLEVVCRMDDSRFVVVARAACEPSEEHTHTHTHVSHIHSSSSIPNGPDDIKQKKITIVWTNFPQCVSDRRVNTWSFLMAALSKSAFDAMMRRSWPDTNTMLYGNARVGGSQSSGKVVYLPALSTVWFWRDLTLSNLVLNKFKHEENRRKMMIVCMTWMDEHALLDFDIRVCKSAKRRPKRLGFSPFLFLPRGPQSYFTWLKRDRETRITRFS